MISTKNVSSSGGLVTSSLDADMFVLGVYLVSLMDPLPDESLICYLEFARLISRTISTILRL